PTNFSIRATTSSRAAATGSSGVTRPARFRGRSIGGDLLIYEDWRSAAGVIGAETVWIDAQTSPVEAHRSTKRVSPPSPGTNRRNVTLSPSARISGTGPR